MVKDFECRIEAIRPYKATSMPGFGMGVGNRSTMALMMASREKTGRQASPTASVIDSQSVTTTEGVGPRGFNAGKKIKGRNRHIVPDTAGHLVGLIVHIASIQARDGAVAVPASIRRLYPLLRYIFTDAAPPATNCVTRCSLSGAGRCNLSNGPTQPRASKSSQDAGLSSGPLRGSGDAAGSSKTSKLT
jgi:hypothetical protein